MIVVAIIGILAAIAIPQYQNYVARTQATEALNLLGGLKTPLLDNMGMVGLANACSTTDSKTLTDQTNSDGTPAPDKVIPAGILAKGNGFTLAGKYVKSITATANNATDCKLTATFYSTTDNTGINDRLSGEKVQFTYTANGGVWDCKTTLSSALAPKTCQSGATITE